MGDQYAREPTLTLRYTGEASSFVYCGPGLLDELGSLVLTLPPRPPRKVILCTDEGVAPFHGDHAAQALAEAGLNVAGVLMQEGEAHKHLQTVADIYGQFAMLGVERNDMVLALGGGVPGDLFGFVAATYLRGLRFVQVPTTLVAQVDSALGGKVGVDLSEGKNMVGAFKHADLVVADVDALRTLPEPEWIAGTAEVLKHGVIADSALFVQLEDSADLWRRRAMPLDAVLSAAIAVKARFVQEDVFETGSRMFLNYGHTYGHALEAAAGYGNLRHGEAVGWGMALEARLAAGIGIVSEEFVVRQDRALRSLGLLVPFRSPPLDSVLSHLYRDKKVRDGTVRWALPAGKIGSCTVREDVPENLVRGVLAESMQGPLVRVPP